MLSCNVTAIIPADGGDSDSCEGRRFRGAGLKALELRREDLRAEALAVLQRIERSEVDVLVVARAAVDGLREQQCLRDEERPEGADSGSGSAQIAASLAGVGVEQYYTLVSWATLVALWNYLRRGVPATWETAEGTR